MVGPGCFLPRPTKKFPPQNGEKTEGRKGGCLMDKNTYVQVQMGNSSNSFLFFFFLFFFFALSWEAVASSSLFFP